MTVPETVKSLKGTQFLNLLSRDGASYDIFVAVPADRNAPEVLALIEGELERLRALDKANEKNTDYDEYTEEDVKKFVSSLGCLPVTPTGSRIVWD